MRTVPCWLVILFAGLFTSILMAVVLPIGLAPDNTVEPPPMGMEFHVPSGVNIENDFYAERMCYASAGAIRSSPNVRLVSNTVFAQSEPIPDSRNLNGLIWGFGQLLAHDIISSPLNTTGPVTLVQMTPHTINLALFQTIRRSEKCPGFTTDYCFESQNLLTGAIDASTLYGDYKNPDLHTQLRVKLGGILRCELIMGPNSTPQYVNDTFFCGDDRCAEQPLLSAFHALFMREHNRLCIEMRNGHRYQGWTEEDLFWKARALIIAITQRITYEEYLPSLLGSQQGLLNLPQQFDRHTTRIMLEFSTVAERVGHSMVSEYLGNWRVRDLFFNASFTIATGIEAIFEAAMISPAETADAKVVDSLRNFLFAANDTVVAGEDLVARNLWRARELGLSDYATLTSCFGTPALPEYATPGMDPLVGALNEPIVAGSSVGYTVARIIAQQFHDLRKNDPLFYTHGLQLTSYDRAFVAATTLRELLVRNTDPIVTGKQNTFFL